MKILLPFILLVISTATSGQKLENLSPQIGRSLDFGPEVQKQWAIKGEIMNALSNGNKSWDALSEQERRILEECGGEAYESMWDVVGVACSWYCGSGLGTITASSYLEAQGDINYEPSNAHDLSYQTAWVEGVDGYGVGEYLEYAFPATNPRLNTVIVVNGYVKSPSTWKNNSRVSKLKMYVDDKPYAILNLGDVPHEQRFSVKQIGYSERQNFEVLKKKPDWKIRFEILDVYKGAKYTDVAISEIYFEGVDVHCLGEGTQISMADGSLKHIELLTVGDEVMSYNQERGVFESAKVLELAAPVHDNLIFIGLNNGEGLTATRDHPFFDGMSWFSHDPAKTMHDYQLNDVSQLKVGLQFGKAKIVSIDAVETSGKTYAIVELSRNNTFIANGVLAGTEPLRVRSDGLKHVLNCPLRRTLMTR